MVKIISIILLVLLAGCATVSKDYTAEEVRSAYRIARDKRVDEVVRAVTKEAMEAAEYSKTEITLKIIYSLTIQEQDEVIQRLERYGYEASIRDTNDVWFPHEIYLSW